MEWSVILLGILFIIPSVLTLIAPKTMLTFGQKWQYKDAEPTDDAVMISKIISIIAIILGTIICIAGFFWEAVEPYLAEFARGF